MVLEVSRKIEQGYQVVDNLIRTTLSCAVFDNLIIISYKKRILLDNLINKVIKMFLLRSLSLSGGIKCRNSMLKKTMN
jgi:hypothetical protein